MPCFTRDFGVYVICSEIAECGKSEQDGASCCYRLVVKLVVKRERVTTKNFRDISSLYFSNHILGIFLVSYKLQYHDLASNNLHKIDTLY